MDNSTIRSTQPSIAGLLMGLVSDLKGLALQEVRLATDEFTEELGKAKTAATSLALGSGLALIGGVLLIFMIVHVIAAAGLPLWASFGLVGALLVGASLYLLMRAKKAATDIHMVPLRTVQTMKENVSWIKEEVTSART
jgi:uncharacterized membrane protein (DUF2068 family)